jgi:hypothetical protein
MRIVSSYAVVMPSHSEPAGHVLDACEGADFAMAVDGEKPRAHRSPLNFDPALRK